MYHLNFYHQIIPNMMSNNVSHLSVSIYSQEIIYKFLGDVVRKLKLELHPKKLQKISKNNSYTYFKNFQT